MPLDMQVVTIGYREPVLWVAVGLSTAIAVAVGALAGRMMAAIPQPGRRRLWGALVTAAALFGLAVLPGLVLGVLFLLVTGGATACAAFVKPALLIPAVTGLAVEWIAWRRTRVNVIE